MTVFCWTQVHVELVDDSWVNNLVALPAGTALVEGLRAVAPQPEGWDKASAGVLGARALTVLDSAHAVITVSQLASYDILYAEEVRLTVPAAAVESAAVLVSNSTLRINPTAGIARLSGTLLESLDEAALRGWSMDDGLATTSTSATTSTAVTSVTTSASLASSSTPMVLTITLSGDSFLPFPASTAYNVSNATATDNQSAAFFNASLVNATLAAAAAAAARAADWRTKFIDSVASSSDAPSGWNAIVQQAISPSDVQQLSSSEVRLTVYPAALYAIDAPETVVVALDAALLSSQVVIPPFSTTHRPALRLIVV